MGLHSEKDQKRFLTILADGKFHEKVEEDTEGAKLRIIEGKDGEEDREVYELTYPGITAMITKIQFFEGDYGTNILIDMEDEDDNQFCVSLACASNYGERFMEVLPNLDLNEEVELVPYAFKPKGATEKVRGLTIKQDDEKLESAFAVKDGDEWEVLIKGFPMPDPKKKYNSEKWKTFFAQRREWVMDYLLDAEMVLPHDAEESESDGADEAEEADDAPEEDAAPAKKAAKKTTKKKAGKKADDDDDF